MDSRLGERCSINPFLIGVIGRSAAGNSGEVLQLRLTPSGRWRHPVASVVRSRLPPRLTRYPNVAWRGPFSGCRDGRVRSRRHVLRSCGEAGRGDEAGPRRGAPSRAPTRPEFRGTDQDRRTATPRPCRASSDLGVCVTSCHDFCPGRSPHNPWVVGRSPPVPLGNCSTRPEAIFPAARAAPGDGRSAHSAFRSRHARRP